ncbi:MAG: hypothetical protein HQL51_07960 [Magnetococcales bacterium]|nr:hypothetical protein [Magnetococcales bacterium]
MSDDAILHNRRRNAPLVVKGDQIFTKLNPLVAAMPRKVIFQHRFWRMENHTLPEGPIRGGLVRQIFPLALSPFGATMVERIDFEIFL